MKKLTMEEIGMRRLELISMLEQVEEDEKSLEEGNDLERLKLEEQMMDLDEAYGLEKVRLEEKEEDLVKELKALSLEEEKILSWAKETHYLNDNNLTSKEKHMPL